LTVFVTSRQTDKNKYVRVERFIKQIQKINRIYMQKTVVNYATVRM